MKKTLAFLLLLAIIIMPANAVAKENVKPVKNVILLIPDGTSLATISIARWLQSVSYTHLQTVFRLSFFFILRKLNHTPITAASQTVINNPQPQKPSSRRATKVNGV